MADADDSTTTTGGTPDSAASVTDAAATGSSTSDGTADSTLASRYAGQTAKVNVLTTEKAAAEARALAAEDRLAAYEAGKVGNDEALRSQLAAEQAKTAAAEQKASLALIKAEYPEAFAELGEAAAALTPDKLASLEARLLGEAEAPTPKRHNESNTTSGATGAAKPKTADDVRAELLAMADPFKRN